MRDATNTGCATLERINGNRVITQANTVLERFDLHGELTEPRWGLFS